MRARIPIPSIVKGCATKTRFRSEPIAQERANQIRAKTGKQLFPYWCGICNHWHLTRQSKPVPANTE